MGSDECGDLRVRIEKRPLGDRGDLYWAIVSAWKPSPEELARLNSGAHVHLVIIGASMPPVCLEVGDAPT